MSKIEKFEDIQAWQKARNVVNSIKEFIQFLFIACLV